MTDSNPPPGEKSLNLLLTTLTATVHPSTFVYTTIPAQSALPLRLEDCEAIINESEGLTLILKQDLADAQSLAYIYPCKKVTLNVHSSLDAVGFIAVIGRKLAARGISANVVAGYFHDHVYIPVGREGEVVQVCEEVRAEALAERM